MDFETSYTLKKLSERVDKLELMVEKLMADIQLENEFDKLTSKSKGEKDGRRKEDARRVSIWPR